MLYPLTYKALEQLAQSYEEYGDLPDEVKAIVSGAAKNIKELIDRPDDEKDALIAAAALMFTKDVVVYKEVPDNLDEYGDTIKTILTDAVAALDDKPYSKSRDLMQIGLALAVSLKDPVMAMLKEAKESLDDIAEKDPRLLKQFVHKFEQAIAKQSADTKTYFTGEQPRLEAKVMEIVDAMKAAVTDMNNHICTLIPPPPAKKGPSISNNEL